MNKANISGYVKLAIVFILAGMLLVGGHALARLVQPATEPGGESQPAAPSYISGDTAYQSFVPPDENVISTGSSAAPAYSYYQVSGATLRNRSTTTQYVYTGKGCSYTTSNSDDHNILNADLLLPDNSVIKYLRVVYSDTNPTSGVEGYITRYEPAKGAMDLVNVGSTDEFHGGYGFAVSSEITVTIDNENYAYTLIGWPDVNSDANQICGLRVAYIAPFYRNVFLPSVHR